MASHSDLSQLELREAFDLAIAIEEDAERRYQQLSTRFAGDPSGVGDVFRAMAVNERKHRDELETRRYAMFREDAQPSDVSPAGEDAERPELGTAAPTPLEALQVVLASERRAHAFYRDALERVSDTAVRSLFEDLMDEEAEHQELIGRQIARLGAKPLAATAA